MYEWMVARIPRELSAALSRDHLWAHFFISLTFDFIICKSITVFGNTYVVSTFWDSSFLWLKIIVQATSLLHAATQSLRRQCEFCAWNRLSHAINCDFVFDISQVLIRRVKILDFFQVPHLQESMGLNTVVETSLVWKIELVLNLVLLVQSKGP